MTSQAGSPHRGRARLHPLSWLRIVTRSAVAVRLGRGLRDAGATVRSALAPVGRRAPEIVLVTAVVLSVLCGLVLVGAARNDARIESDLGRAVGEVLDGSSGPRTFVRFTAADGAVLTPEDGVFYSRGLEAGQLVRVEYDRSEPELVRVEGRDWSEGLVPMLLAVVGIWAVLGSLSWWLRRRRSAAAAAVPGPAEPPGTDRTPVGSTPGTS